MTWVWHECSLCQAPPSMKSWIHHCIIIPTWSAKPLEFCVVNDLLMEYTANFAFGISVDNIKEYPYQEWTWLNRDHFHEIYICYGIIYIITLSMIFLAT